MNILCKLFGHKWKAGYIGEVIRFKARWVYLDDVCGRCYKREVRLPPPNIEVAVPDTEAKRA